MSVRTQVGLLLMILIFCNCAAITVNNVWLTLAFAAGAGNACARILHLVKP